MENRLEALRAAIDPLIARDDPAKYRMYLTHMYGVARFCTLLALRRGLDAELATTSGMLHDIHYMTGGSGENHAALGAERARAMLHAMNAYGDEEIETVATAISRHSMKGAVHGPYDELLKDADVMDHCLYNAAFPIAETEMPRYASLCAELGILSTGGR